MVAEVARVNFNMKSSFIYLCLTQVEHSTAAANEEQQKELNDFLSYYKKVLLPLEFFVQLANRGVDTGISIIIDTKSTMISGDLVSLQEYHHYTLSCIYACQVS
jgi:hypothetical protein